MRPALLIFTEGEKTEPHYLTEWHRCHRLQVSVTIDPRHVMPLTLVQLAVEQMRDHRRAERRGAGRAYDEVWCMFDIDEHPNMHRALELARENGIHLAVTNPCIELWFIIHFDSRTAWIDRHEAQRQSKALLGVGKVLTPAAFEELAARHEQAADRARDLDKMHDGNGSPEGSNPSTGAWRVVDAIRRTS